MTPTRPPSYRLCSALFLLGFALLLSACSKPDQAPEKSSIPPSSGAPAAATPPPQVRPTTLLAARKGFQTRIVTQEGYTPDGAAPVPPRGLLERITYRSPAGELVAYMTPRPTDGRRHPAVVWAHGGFGGIGDWLWKPATRKDDQTASAFREAGLVLMIPSFRGENDNPGQLEMFYGEVDDLLAAMDHVMSLPWVDPERVYLAGHSSGATLVLLAATATDRFRAAFVFGSWIGMSEDPNDLRAMRLLNKILVPFDVSRPEEARLRTAMNFAEAIRRPTYYFEGEEFALPAMPVFTARARRAGAPFTAFNVKGGNHWNILYPLTRLVAKRIVDDVGPTCELRISEQDVASAFAQQAR